MGHKQEFSSKSIFDKYKGKSLKEVTQKIVAKDLGYSLSTFKRRLKDYKIKWIDIIELLNIELERIEVQKQKDSPKIPEETKEKIPAQTKITTKFLESELLKAYDDNNTKEVKLRLLKQMSEIWKVKHKIPSTISILDMEV